MILVVGMAVLLMAALGGYAVVRARAQGSGAHQTLAPVPLPSPSASTSVQPQYERWTVIKVVAPLRAYARPSTSSPVKMSLAKVNRNGYPTVVLVDSTREVKGRTWYRVWLAMRPNGTRGWIPQAEGKMAFYTTSAQIVIDLSERKLTVYRRGLAIGRYPVAVGMPGLETPTGRYFVNQKLRPPTPHGAYGVLAIGISAFQMKYAASDWDQGGPVAIHGTNRDYLIGKAVSHGCVRMHNKDVLKVSAYVPSGSPVTIQE